MEKTVGVLGGMGPEATAIFFLRLVEVTPGDLDQDHLKIIILNDPKIPDRARHILNPQETSPLPHLTRVARQLEAAGADFIVIPCNTAHYLWQEIQDSVGIPVLNIIEETARALEAHQREGERLSGPVGILATSGCLHAGLFQEALGRRGIGVLLPEPVLQEDIQKTIETLKSGKNRDWAIAVLQRAIRDLQGRGAVALIYGCTEIRIIAESLHPEVPVFDTVDVLAVASVRFARQCS